MGKPGETAEHRGCRLQRTCRLGLRGLREARQGHAGTEGERGEEKYFLEEEVQRRCNRESDRDKGTKQREN